MSHAYQTSLLVVGGAVALCLLACAGTPNGPAPADRDVRGNYTLTYDNTLTLRLNIAGAVRERQVNGMDETVDFGSHEGKPLTLDLKAYCAREEVVCPSESLWNKVSIDQQDHEKNFDVHIINVIDNTTRDLPAGKRAGVVGGLVDHKKKDEFLLGLGTRSASNKDCGILEISLAGGRFTHSGEFMEDVTLYRTPDNKVCDPNAMNSDAPETEPTPCNPVVRQQLKWPAGAPVVGIEKGRVAVGWLAACAFGPIIAGATLTAETGFTGKRVGDFDPPPFTPITDPDVPDSGFPDMAVDMNDMTKDMVSDQGTEMGEDMAPDM